MLIPAGIGALDRELRGGYYRGDLVVLGGGTGDGKSSCMMLAAIAQAKLGRRPGIVSVEDPRARWGHRLLSTISGVPVRALQAADLTQYQWTQVQGAALGAAPLAITLAFAVGGTIDDVRHAMRRLVRDHGCDTLAVDYLQAIEGGAGKGDSDNERLRLRRIISTIKREANRAGSEVPVVLGSQYKRRKDKHAKPQVEDLYESGYIEQKAETIVLMWRDGHGAVRSWLAKTKDGPIGAEWVLERDARTGLLREPVAGDDANAEWRDE